MAGERETAVRTSDVRRCVYRADSRMRSVVTSAARASCGSGKKAYAAVVRKRAIVRNRCRVGSS
jgi:hypothetical protein